MVRFNLLYCFSKIFFRKRSKASPPNFAPPFCAFCLIVCDFLPKTWNLRRKKRNPPPLVKTQCRAARRLPDIALIINNSSAATTTTAASGGNREELLGPRPAIRKQCAADAGCRNPSACGGNREARLGPRSDFSRPRQGAVEKSVNATRQGGTPQIQLLGECLPGKLNPDSLQRGLVYFICILPPGRKDGTIK